MSVAALAEATGEGFPSILAARERTAAGLAERRARLREVVLDPDASVVLLGSWGRREVTSASDDDAIVLFAGAPRDRVRPEPGQVANLLGGPSPGPEGLFGATAWLEDLAGNLGLEGDTNTILTRRMLFLLESVPVAGDAAYLAARDGLLGTYLTAHERDFRPPRFLLNDLVRYWRTIAVDFEGKHRARAGEGWGLRLAKLRFSRKALFAGGLFPVLACHALPAADMPAFLSERLAEPPLDRIARAFLDYRMPDAGARALRAYGAFLETLDDPEARVHLAGLSEAEAEASETYLRVTESGDDFQAALLALLFEVPELERLVRDYLIF